MNGFDDFDRFIGAVPDGESDVVPGVALTDEALAAGSLVKLDAFIRSPVSAAALRVQKHREKKESQGVKQLNVQVTDDARQVIKVIAARTSAGESVQDVLRSLIKERLTVLELEALIVGDQVIHLAGWRKRVVSALGVAFVS